SVSPSGAWRVALDGGGVEALPPLGGAWLGALDVDGDGRPDRAALSPEEGGWRVEVDLAYGGWGRVDLSVWIEGEARPLLGDVDGDGRAEVARRVEGRWIFEAPLAAARATLLILEGAPPDPTALGDVDGDGRADLITWARGEGGWRWSWAPVVAGDYAARGAWIGGPLSAQPLLGDVDGDGRVDATWIEVTSAGGRWWVSDTREVGGVFALGAGPWRAIEGAWGDAKATPLWWPYAE
ncbi:VCBS repeat-containing protein, partial [Myxococcota bacterium]|nr:VCBS repeat-containing protein [Myxococcota bacterium]